MKKLFMLLCLCCFTFAVVGCSGDDAKKDDTKKNDTTKKEDDTKEKDPPAEE